MGALTMYTGIALAQCSDCYDLELAQQDPLAVRSLHLSNHGLEQIPAVISEMKNLEVLDLSFNQIACIDSSLDHNTKLRELNLSHNPGFNTLLLSEHFQKEVPLEKLNLSYCSIYALGNAFCHLKSLRELNLEHNGLRAFPQELSAVKLLTLDLSDNNLQPVYHAFSDFWSLRQLDISNNDSLNLNSVLQNLAFKDSLHTLRFSPLTVTKSMAHSLEQTGIENLVFTDTEIRELHGLLSRNKTLRSVSFENCELVFPSRFYRVLSRIEQLDDLSFYETPVYKETEQLKQLERLTIENSEVAAPETLPLKKLSELNWSDSERDMSEALKTISAGNPKLKTDQQRTLVTEAMAQNRLEPIVRVAPVEKQIDPAGDNLLQFEDTECRIEKNTFLDENGKPYAGKVNIELREYTDPLLNALAGAPMTAQSSRGDELFASNGMIEFRATDEKGNELQIDPEKPVQITLRDQQPQTRGALYAYDTVRNTWNNIGTPVASNYDSLFRLALDSLNQIDASKLVTRMAIQPNYSLYIKRHRHDPYVLTFTSRGYAFRTPKLRSNGSILYYRQDCRAAKKICSHTWLMDSVSTATLDSIFKDMRKRQRGIKFVDADYFFSPRLFRDLQITPDFERDNFRLSFKYCGQEFDLPVYLENARNPRATIARQKKFYERYSLERNRELRKEERREKELQEETEKMAEALRIQRATAIAWMKFIREQDLGVTPLTGNELLRFGIRNTGLFNCDYFARTRPDILVNLPDTLHSSDGKSFAVPPSVRLVIKKDNAYFETLKDRVPVIYEKQCILLIPLENDQLAVVDNWRPGESKSEYRVRVINTKDMPAQTIRNLILNA